MNSYLHFHLWLCNCNSFVNSSKYQAYIFIKFKINYWFGEFLGGVGFRVGGWMGVAFPHVSSQVSPDTRSHDIKSVGQ